MPVCNPLPFRMDRTCDLLLTNRLWQKWWISHPWLGYIIWQTMVLSQLCDNYDYVIQDSVVFFFFFCLLALEVGSWKSRWLQGCFLLRAMRAGSTRVFSPGLVDAMFSLGLFTSSSPYECLCVQISPLNKDTSDTGLGPTLMTSFYYLQKDSTSKQVSHCKLLGARTPIYFIFWTQLNLSVQFSSVTQLCPTLCDPINRSTPGLPVHHQLPNFTQTHVHRVSDAIQPSNPLSSPTPLPPISPSIRVFSNESTLHIEVAKVLEFQVHPIIYSNGFFCDLLDSLSMYFYSAPVTWWKV